MRFVIYGHDGRSSERLNVPLFMGFVSQVGLFAGCKVEGIYYSKCVGGYRQSDVVVFGVISGR